MINNLCKTNRAGCRRQLHNYVAMIEGSKKRVEEMRVKICSRSYTSLSLSALETASGAE